MPSRSPRTARRSSSSSATLRRRRGDPLVPPDPDEREQVARGALRARRAGDGPRHRQPDPLPIAKLVRRTLREIEPHARELGSERELEGIAALLDRGNRAERQLRIFNANRDIVEVVRAIADATEPRGTLTAGVSGRAGPLRSGPEGPRVDRASGRHPARAGQRASSHGPSCSAGSCRAAGPRQVEALRAPRPCSARGRRRPPCGRVERVRPRESGSTHASSRPAHPFVGLRLVDDGPGSRVPDGVDRADAVVPALGAAGVLQHEERRPVARDGVERVRPGEPDRRSARSVLASMTTKSCGGDRRRRRTSTSRRPFAERLPRPARRT